MHEVQFLNTNLENQWLIYCLHKVIRVVYYYYYYYLIINTLFRVLGLITYLDGILIIWVCQLHIFTNFHFIILRIFNDETDLRVRVSKLVQMDVQTKFD